MLKSINLNPSVQTFHRITKLNKVLAKNARLGITVPCSTCEYLLYQWLDLLSVRQIRLKTLQYEIRIQIVSSLSAYFFFFFFFFFVFIK